MSSAVIAIALATCSCSFVGVRGPWGPFESSHEHPRPCTRGVGLIVLDGVGATVGLGMGAALVVSGATSQHTDPRYGGSDIPFAVSVPFLVAGAVYAASALLGAYHVHQCRQVVRQAQDAAR